LKNFIKSVKFHNFFVNTFLSFCIYISFFFFLTSCSSRGFLTNSIVNQDIALSSIQFLATKTSIRVQDSSTKRIYIEFPTDKAFLTAGKSIDKASYKMAAFKFKESIQIECKNQTIESIKSSANSIIMTGNLSGNNCSTGYTILIKADSPLTISIDASLSNSDFNRIRLVYSSNEDEQFFGFGEQYSHFNLKGKKLFLFTEEQGIGRGDQPITFLADITNGAGGNEFTSYAPIPHYITSENKSVFFENTSYSKFDLSNTKEVNVEFWESNLNATIWLGNSPLELIEKFTLKTGRFPLLPEWAYGTWLGLQGGSEKVKKVVQDAKAAGNPITALWIQDWVGKRTTGFGDQLKWRWYAQEKSENKDSNGDPEPSYPDFKNFCAEMNKDGVKVLGYINSFLADTNPAIKNDTFKNPMLEIAKEKGYLVKNKEGKDYLIKTVGFPAYLIDLTNPEAVKWIKDIIKKNMIDQGLSGWMADFGEWLPYDAVLYDKKINAALYHNVYPVDWARINREAISEAKKDGQIVFFTRAGYSYSAKYSTAFWLGDQMVSFGKDDGLASTIVGLNSSGVSGISINHSDIGGYTGIKALPKWISPYDREKELTERWTEMNAFTPIFRTHEGNIPKRFHQVYRDADSISKFAKMGKVHYALKDYISFLSKKATEKGYPIVRHPYLNFPDDSNTFDIKYQFMLGEDLLVLPILDKGETKVEGYFPKGKWKHLFTGEILDGGKRHTIKAPLGQPAAFVRENGEWSEKIYLSVKNALK